MSFAPGSFYPKYVSTGFLGISSVGVKQLLVGTPANILPGNLLVAVYQSSVALASLTTPPGWLLGGVSAVGKGFWIYKIADGTEGDHIIVSWSETARVFGRAFQYYGINVGGPIGSNAAHTATISPILADGILTNAPGSLVLCFELFAYNAPLDAPAGFTLSANDAETLVGQDASITASTVVVPVSGDSSPGVGASIPSTILWTAFQIELIAANIGAIDPPLPLIKQLAAGAVLGSPGTGGWYSWWMVG